MNCRKRRAQFFEIDAIIAIGLLFIGLMYVRSLTAESNEIVQSQHFSDDSVELFRTMTVSELKDISPALLTSIESGVITAPFTNRTFSLGKQVAMYYFQADIERNRDPPNIAVANTFEDSAKDITKAVLDRLIPAEFGYNASLRSADSQIEVYSRAGESNTEETSENVVLSKTLITGLQQDQPLRGRLARLYLGNIRGLQSKYVYFGGFTGQGEIEFKVTLPANIEVRGVYFEGMTGAGISVSVNDNACGSINVNLGGMFSVSKAELSSCIIRFISDENTIKFTMSGSDNSKYIGGGYFRVRYVTPTFESEPPETTQQIKGINGIVNTYDSVYFDGNLNELSMRLHYRKTPNTAFVATLGNTEIYRETGSGDFDAILSNDQLSSKFDYSELSNKNLPLKIEALPEKASIVLAVDRSSYIDYCFNDELPQTSDGNSVAPMPSSPKFPGASDWNFGQHSWFSVSNKDQCLNNCDKGICRYKDGTDYYNCGDYDEGLYSYGSWQCKTNVYYETMFGSSWSSGQMGADCHGTGINNNHWSTYTTYKDGSSLYSSMLGTMANSSRTECEYSYAESPTISLSGATYPYLIIESKTKNGCKGTIEISDNGGSSWSSIGSCSAYNSLSSYINKDIKIRLVFDSGSTFDNITYEWYVDNAVVYESNSGNIYQCSVDDMIGGTRCSDISSSYCSTSYYCGSDCTSFCPRASNYYYNSLNRKCIECKPIKIKHLKDFLPGFVNHAATRDDNKMALIGYGNDASCSPSQETLTGDKNAINDKLTSFDASCGSNACVHCAIEKAKNILKDETDTRKVIVLVSSGRSTTGKSAVVEAARNACKNNGISILAISAGNDVDSVLEDAANANRDEGCGGKFLKITKDSSIDSINSAYDIVADHITFAGQAIESHATDISGKIYPDSYVKYTADKNAVPLQEKNVRFSSETDILSGCNKEMDLSGLSSLEDVKLLSYSDRKWTSSVKVNGNNLYDGITSYKDSIAARRLGDPFVFGIPLTSLGTSKKLGFESLATMDEKWASGLCSTQNKVIYTSQTTGSIVVNSEVLEKAEGCRWTVQYTGGNQKEINLPAGYTGQDRCTYTKASHVNPKEDPKLKDDTLISVMYNLLNELDTNDDGEVDTSFEQKDLEIDIQDIEQIPFMYGPAVFEVRVWR